MLSLAETLLYQPVVDLRAVIRAGPPIAGEPLHTEHTRWRHGDGGGITKVRRAKEREREQSDEAASCVQRHTAPHAGMQV